MTELEALTTAQLQTKQAVKGLEPLLEALITAYVSGTKEIKNAVNEIQAVKENKEVSKLLKSIDKSLGAYPKVEIIQEQRQTIKALQDVVRAVEKKELAVDLITIDLSKVEKCLDAIEQLIKIPLEDGRVAVKLSEEDLKRLTKNLGSVWQTSATTSRIANKAGQEVNPATEDTLALLLAQLQAINANTDTLEIKADTINLNVDGIESKLDTLITQTDTLESNTTGLATQATLATRLSESDFDSKVGSLTETAPASDTASSGLNGRLQRIAQRITSLIALIPAALTAAGNFKVSLQESNTSQAVTGTFWQATQPVSAASLPLPTGATTETTLAKIPGMAIPIHDYISLAVAATTDTYTFKTGGSGGTTVATVTITYTDSTKATLSSVAKT